VKETVYNLFVYVQKSMITELGIASHELEGTDEDKKTTLQVLARISHQELNFVVELRNRGRWH
jgi:hypothetical protein